MTLLRRVARRILLGPPPGRPRVPRALRGAVALACFAVVVITLASTGTAPTRAQESGQLAPDADTETVPLPEDRPLPLAGGAPAPTDLDPAKVRLGRRLFVDGCSSCHGFDARGIPDRAPTLHGVGELSADFYLRTGRMPLDDPEDEPLRKQSPYTPAQIDALVAYVGSLGGPPIPEVHPQRGDLADGQRLFALNCAGCHQVVGKGGIIPRAFIPDLEEGVNALDVAEAMEIGPYVMPNFTFLTQHEIDSIARYVLYTQDPADHGGWGIGHIGPIPEGMVTFFIGMAGLLLVIRLIGERTTS